MPAGPSARHPLWAAAHHQPRHTSHRQRREPTPSTNQDPLTGHRLTPLDAHEKAGLVLCATAAFVDGRGSRLAAGRTPLAGAAAQAASDSRSWCRRRVRRARRRRPPPGWRPSRRRAAPRTAPAAPRSAGPGPGRARSPPTEGIEHKFENESGTLRSPTEPLTAYAGRAGAATRRNLGDSKGQQETTNLEVSSRFAAIHLGGETAGLRFHTAEPAGPMGSGCSAARPV